MLFKSLNKTMNNLRLWGYDRYQMHDAQQNHADAARAQQAVNAGLVEKFNQLKKNVQESSQQLATELHNKTNNEHIQIEANLNNIRERSQHHLHNFENLQQNLVEIAARASSEILEVQQDIETGAVQHEHNKQEQDSAWLHAEQAHENIMKNLNLSIKKFQEYKEALRAREAVAIAQHQSLIRRLGDLYAEKQLHKLLVIQIWSKSSNLRKNKKVRLMNNEIFYQFPIKYKLLKLQIFSSSNLIFSQPLKFTIHLDSRILVTAWGPFPKTFEINREIEPNMKIYFTINGNTTDGLYAEFIREAI
jgi:hypothetical protein